MTPLLLVCALLAAELSSSPQPLLDEFDEPLMPLAAAQLRDEAEQARLAAEALYAHGRLLLQRREFSAALRRFQRAWRYHPQGEVILPRIVLLAHQLRRPDEAIRYALLAEEPTGISSALLRQLAVQASARQDWPSALTLFEASLPARARSAAPLGEPDEDLAALLVYLEIGRLALVTRDFAKSADYFARVQGVWENPERLAANEAVQQTLLGQADRSNRLMAEAFFLAGRYDEAEAAARRAYPQAAGQPAPPELDFALARIAAKRGRTDAAMQHLQGYFAARASEAGSEPYALLAELVEAAEPDAAAAQQALRSQLEKLLEADPQNTALLAYLAELELRAGHWEAAEQRFEQLLVLQPSSNVYLGLAEIHARHSRWDKLAELCGIQIAKGGSLAELTQLLESLDDYPEARGALLALVQQQRQDEAQQVPAGALLAAAVVAELNSESSAESRGESNGGPESTGEADGAAADPTPLADALFAAAAARWEPPVRGEMLLAWGLKLLVTRHSQRAVPVLRRALAEELPAERRFAGYFYLTRALALADQVDAALQVAAEATEAFPDAPRLLAQPGWVQYYAKRYQEAQRSYESLLERFDSQPASDVRDTLRDARLILSNLGVLTDRMAEAEEWLEQVLDEFPEDAGALNDLGYLWADQGKSLARALEMTRRAVAAQPDNAAYRDSLGWALYRLGRIPEAIRELEQAAAGDDPDGVILDHLGDAYLRADRIAEAVAIWRRAAAAFAREEDREKQLATEEKIKRYEK